MLHKPTERGRGKVEKGEVDDDTVTQVAPGVGRGRTLVRGRGSDDVREGVGRSRGMNLSTGNGVGRGKSLARTGGEPSQYEDASATKSDASPAPTPPESRFHTPRTRSSGSPSPVSTPGRSLSRSGRSTPDKSSSVSPASTPGRSAGLSWGSTFQEGSPFGTPKRSEQTAMSRLEMMSIEDQLLPPQKRISANDRPPKFPGTDGRTIELKANYFPVQVKIPNGKIHMYDVNISPPWTRPYRRSDRLLFHQVIQEWKKVCPQVRNNPHCWVFDGKATLYSTMAFHDGEIEDVRVTIPGEVKPLVFVVMDVLMAKTIPVNRDILEYVLKGRSGFLPQDSLHALNVILQQAPTTDLNFETFDRSYFPREGHVLDIGFGREVWAGIFNSVRPVSSAKQPKGGWKDDSFLLSLNVDVSNKPALRPLHFTEESKAGAGDSYIHQILKSRRGPHVNFSKGLTVDQIEIFSKDVKGLKVRYELPNGNKRQYKVNDVKQSPKQLTIPGLNKTVEQYFLENYKDQIFQLKYPNMPCLWLGSREKSIFIPVEFCRLESQPQPRAKKLQDDAVSNMIRLTAVKPLDRQKKIMEGLRKNNNVFKNDPYAREFGITISGEMSTLNGRVLAPPSIQYKDSKAYLKNPGSWRMSNRDKYVDGKRIEAYAVLDLAPNRPGPGAVLTDSQFNQMIKGFNKVGSEVGMNITGDKNSIMWKSSTEDRAEEDFKHIFNYHQNSAKKIQIILVLLPFKGSDVYDKIKHLGDIMLKMPTQCCVKATMFKQNPKTRENELSLQVLSNLCLKMNSKLGGKNHVLERQCRPALFDKPIMIMGADVTHPAPEHRGTKPSIAAIVGSQDPNASRYEVQMRMQSGEQNEEIIQDMKEVTVHLLKKFFANAKGKKPERIIMFRDGVSEGQFLKVLSSELLALKAACRELEEGYEPLITYVVVQKRHHTRFFPASNDKANMYKNGNVIVGTVVDQGINHPTEGDYYLLSHEGIQGTSRPTHYHVLWDDSDMCANDMERLTYFLCHLYSRCTRSVSYPTPTYYAHLAADRARKHHNDMVSKDTWLSNFYIKKDGFKKEPESNEESIKKKSKEEEIKRNIETAESIAMYYV